MSWIFVKQNAVPWSPSNATSLKMWYDFSELSLANNTSLVGTTIFDKSGNDKGIPTNISAGLGLLRVAQNEINSLTCVDAPTFSAQSATDIRSDLLRMVDVASTITNTSGGSTAADAPNIYDAVTDAYIAWVAKPYSVSRGISQGMVIVSRVAGASVRMAGMLTSADVFNVLSARTSETPISLVGTTAVTAGSPHLYSARTNFGNGTAAIYLDANQEASGTYASSGACWGKDAFYGDSMFGGYVSNPRSNGLHGAIGEVVGLSVQSGAVPTEEIQKLEGYLAHKWGLTANLPAGHPYKSAAPTV